MSRPRAPIMHAADPIPWHRHRRRPHFSARQVADRLPHPSDRLPHPFSDDDIPRVGRCTTWNLTHIVEHKCPLLPLKEFSDDG